MQAAHQLAPRQRHQGNPNAYESEIKERGIKFIGRKDSSGVEMFDRDGNPMTTYQHEGHGHLVQKQLTAQQNALFFQHHQIQANGGTVNVHLHELALQQELSKRMQQMQQQQKFTSSSTTQSSSSSSVTIAQFVQPEMSTSSTANADLNQQQLGNGAQSPPSDLTGVGGAKMGGGAVDGQRVETVMAAAANTSMDSIKKNYGLEESDYEESPRKDNPQNGVEKKTISYVIDEDEPEEEMEQDEDEPEVDNALNNGVGTSSSFTTKTISESALTAASLGTSSSSQQMQPFLSPNKVRGTAAELNALTATLSTTLDKSTAAAADADEDTAMNNAMLDETTAANNTLNESTSSTAKRARKKKQPLTLTGTKKPRRRFLEDEYIASRIEAERGRGRNKEYYIKWEGHEDLTWEPARHFQQFYLLVEDFEARKRDENAQRELEASLEQLDAEKAMEEAKQQQEALEKEEAPMPPKSPQKRRAASKRRASRSTSTSAKRAKKEEGTLENVGAGQPEVEVQQVHQEGQVQQQEEEKQPTTSSDRPRLFLRRNIRSSKKHMGIEKTPEPGVNFTFGEPSTKPTNIPMEPNEQPKQPEMEPPSRPLTRRSLAEQEARARELLKESSPDPAVVPPNAAVEPQLPQQPAADAVEPDRPVKRRSGSTKRSSAKKEKVGPAASTPFTNEQNTNNIAYGQQQQLDGYDNPRKRSRSVNQRQSLSAKLHAEQTPIGRRNARRPQNNNNVGGPTPPMNNTGQSTSTAHDGEEVDFVAETPMTAVTTRSRARKNAVVGNVQQDQQQPMQNAPPMQGEVQGRVPSAILDMRNNHTSVLVRFPDGEEEWQPMDVVKATAHELVIAHLLKKLEDVAQKLDDVGRFVRND